MLPRELAGASRGSGRVLLPELRRLDQNASGRMLPAQLPGPVDKLRMHAAGLLPGPVTGSGCMARRSRLAR